MLAKLMSAPKVVGVKQTRKAIREGRAALVFLARDADPALTEPLAGACTANGIALDASATMAELGKACGIAVGASVAAVLVSA